MNKKPIRIIVAGMGQSGSTALFNLIRWVCEDNGLQTLSFISNEGKKIPEDINKYNIILEKDHLSENWKDVDIIFTPRRDIRDCVASKRRRDNLASGLHGCFVAGFHNIFLYERTIEKGGISIHYEDMKTNPLKTAKEIADRVGICSPSLEKAIEKLHNLANGNCDKPYEVSAFHPKMLTNKGIIGGYKTTLSEKEVNLMNNCFGWWLKKEGYDIDKELEPNNSFLCFVKTLDDLFGVQECFGRYWAANKKLRPDLIRNK